MLLSPEAQSIPLAITTPGHPECKDCPAISGKKDRLIRRTAKHRTGYLLNLAGDRTFQSLGKVVGIAQMKAEVSCKIPWVNRILYPRGTLVNVEVDFLGDVRFGIKNSGLIFPQYAGDKLNLGCFNCPYLQRRSH